jgi:exosortase
VALGLFAYRPLLLTALQAPGFAGIEGWFFRPTALPPALVLAAAGWLLWRRRERLRALPPRRSPAAAGSLLALGAALFVWAHYAGATDLLLPSLAAQLLAGAGAVRGRAGLRAVLLPACVLLLGLRLPAPVHDELVWRLQLAAAAHAAWLVERFGTEVAQSGVLLFHEAYVFQVIDACSGFRGIGILTLIAVLVREAWAASGSRQWLPVLAAPLLGHALNVVRIAVIVASDDPGALAGEANHAPQGLAVLVAGTGLLWALAAGLAGLRPAPAERTSPPRAAHEAAGALHRPLVAAWLLSLAGLSLAVPARAGGVSQPWRPLELPERRAGWVGEELEPDRWFLGPLPFGQSVYRRYVRHAGEGSEPQVVELLAAYELLRDPVTSRLFGSRLLRPGSGWTVERAHATELPALGADGDLAVVSPPADADGALVLVWRLRDQGLWREAWRSWLRLEATPFQRAERRAIVRLATPVSEDGGPGYEQARRTLDAFIADFRDELAAL